MISITSQLVLSSKNQGGDTGFDGVSKKSSASRLDTTLTVQKLVSANNNAHFEAVALAA